MELVNRGFDTMKYSKRLNGSKTVEPQNAECLQPGSITVSAKLVLLELLNAGFICKNSMGGH